MQEFESNSTVTSKSAWIVSKYCMPVIILAVFCYSLSDSLERNASTPDAVLQGSILMACFCALFLLPSYLYSYIEMDDKGIKVSSVFRGAVAVPFEEIESISGPFFITFTPIRIKIKSRTKVGRNVFTPVPYLGGNAIVSELQSRLS